MSLSNPPDFLEPESLDAIEGHDVLLQTGFWGRFKGSFGWKPSAFLIDGRLPLLALTRKLGAGFSLCYVPHGPLSASTHNWSEYYLAEITRRLVAYLPAGCVFIRYDLPWGRSAAEERPLKPPFRRAPMDIQPASTVVLDLRPSEGSILAGMKAKTRYNIRLAEKRGVVVTVGALRDVEEWYALYRETAERDRIAIHSLAYYKRLVELSIEPPRAEAAPPWWETNASRSAPVARPRIELLLARAGEARGGREAGDEGAGSETSAKPGTLLAGIFVAICGKRATYLFGASSNAHRNLMASYLVQLEAIRLARRAGCELYDLFGIPFRDDPQDPMYGLYRFKTGFGGTILHRPGSWDFPLRRRAYALYRLAEGYRRWYYKRFKKRRSSPEA